MYADYLTKCGTAHICHCCSSRLISPARRAHGSNPAAAGLLLWAHAGTDRRTPYIFIVPDLHTTQAVPHILIKNFSCKIVVKPVCLSDCMHIFVYKKGWLGSWVVSMLDSGAEGTGFKSQSRRFRVTVLGKLFIPIVPLFTKQQNW